MNFDIRKRRRSLIEGGQIQPDELFTPLKEEPIIDPSLGSQEQLQLGGARQIATQRGLLSRPGRGIGLEEELTIVIRRPVSLRCARVAKQEATTHQTPTELSACYAIPVLKGKGRLNLRQIAR